MLRRGILYGCAMTLACGLWGYGMAELDLGWPGVLISFVGALLLAWGSFLTILTREEDNVVRLEREIEEEEAGRC